MANTILNAGYLQLDNSFTDLFRVVWGVRYENFDQLVGRFASLMTGIPILKWVIFCLL